MSTKPLSTTAQPMDDRAFLAWFDLERPSLAEARRLAAAGDVHAAALAAAAAAGEGVWPGLIRAAEAPAIAAAIAAHAPGSPGLEREVAELWLRPELPAEGSLGPVDELRLGRYARTGRSRGYESMALALLAATTGERRYGEAAVAAAVRRAATFPADGGPPLNIYHPCAPEHLDHEMHNCLEYWLPVWPLLETWMRPEERLALLKAMLPAARSLLLANRDDIAFNLTLHPTMATLSVAAAFPALRESAAWLDEIAARLTTTYAGAPFSTPDGYTREGTGYHSVNARMLLWAHLLFRRGLGRDLPALAVAAERAVALQVPFTCPDGTGWMLGDGLRFFLHEPWVEGHDQLHLGAAVFARPAWKALAGSIASVEPNLLTLWLMGAEGIARWAMMPRVDLANRAFADSDAPASVCHVLRAGRGVDAHAGMLWFGSEMNHAHHDKGQVLLYGLGRHLLSDHGHPGYGGGDMVPGFSARVHGVAAIIRRTPMGPRTDFADHVRHLARVRTPQASLAMGEHHYYENHIIQRALVLVKPWGEADPARDAFWLVWDQVMWKRGWPGTAPEIREIVETGFPFHAPGCSAVVCDGGRSIVSRYDGPGGAPYTAGGLTREQLRTAHRYHDSDANLQVTRLATPGSDATWDAVVTAGQTNTTGGPMVPRPFGLFRWRGRLAHHAGYVLVPFRGVRDDVAATVAGEAGDDGLSARVAMPGGTVQVAVRGLRTQAPTVTVACG